MCGKSVGGVRESVGQVWSSGYGAGKDTLVKFHWVPTQGGCGEAKCGEGKCGRCVGNSGHGASKETLVKFHWVPKLRKSVGEVWKMRGKRCSRGLASKDIIHFIPVPANRHLFDARPCAFPCKQASSRCFMPFPYTYTCLQTGI